MKEGLEIVETLKNTFSNFYTCLLLVELNLFFDCDVDSNNIYDFGETVTTRESFDGIEIVSSSFLSVIFSRI